MRQHLHLAGDGEVFPYCCNSDFCNTDMCKAMGLPSGHNLCTTTIEHKLKEQQLIQQPPLKQKPQNGQQAILSAVSYLIYAAHPDPYDGIAFFFFLAEC